MLVNVQNSHINSTEDAKLIPELVESGFYLDDVSIDFRESHSKSTKEQHIQVQYNNTESESPPYTLNMPITVTFTIYLFYFAYVEPQFHYIV